MEKKSNGGLIALVIILGLLVCGLGGYIAYDKIGNNQDNKQDVKEPQKVNIANLYKSVDLDYAINSKTVKVGFNYTIEKDINATNEDWEKPYKIYVLLSFDGVVDESKKYLVDAYKTENECKNSSIYSEIGRNNVNIIKGDDKEYFVFYLKEFTEAAPRRTLKVLNENGTLIHNVKFEMGNSFNIPASNYSDYEMFYITNDALYYIDNTCGNYDEKVGADDNVYYVLKEYKLTINNGKAVIIKNNTYETTLAAGQSC